MASSAEQNRSIFDVHLVIRWLWKETKDLPTKVWIVNEKKMPFEVTMQPKRMRTSFS